MMNESEEKEKHSPDTRGYREPGSKPSWKLLLGAALIFGTLMFLVGYYGRSTFLPPMAKDPVEPRSQTVGKAADESQKNILYWTCPMHPQVHMSEPGKCPTCHMDLAPVYG
jgi:hypothetical protein